MLNRIRYLLLFSILLQSTQAQSEHTTIGEIKYNAALMATGEGQPSLAVCDFNADGNLDIVIANYDDGTLKTYQGDGTGKLVKVSQFPVGDNPSGIDVSDINTDGHLDLVIANHETSYITILLGDGTGQFKSSAQSPLRIESKPHPHTVRLADLNGDGNVDLVADSRSQEGLRVLNGNGNGMFETPGYLVDAGGDPYRGFAINDLNGDGHLDIVTPNQHDVAIILNTGHASKPFTLTTIPQTESPFSVDLADMTGDQHQDLVLVSNENSISIIPGDSTGSFIDAKKSTLDSTPGAKQIALGDIDGNHIKDALISNWTGQLLIAFGGKESIRTVTFSHPRISHPWGIALADLNNDGKNDIIIADGESAVAVVYVSQ